MVKKKSKRYSNKKSITEHDHYTNVVVTALFAVLVLLIFTVIVNSGQKDVSSPSISGMAITSGDLFNSGFPWWIVVVLLIVIAIIVILLLIFKKKKKLDISSVDSVSPSSSESVESIHKESKSALSPVSEKISTGKVSPSQNKYPEVASYIKDALAAGAAKPDIKVKLNEAGWPDEIIEESFQEMGM